MRRRHGSWAVRRGESTGIGMPRGGPRCRCVGALLCSTWAPPAAGHRVSLLYASLSPPIWMRSMSYTRGSHPHDWARTQNNLGGCLLEPRRAAEWDRRGGVSPRCRHRLSERFPCIYERVFPTGLGGHPEQPGGCLPGPRGATERERGDGEPACGRHRLSECSADPNKSVAPQDWAMTQNNLGAAHLRDGEPAGARHRFPECSQDQNKTAAPQDWAMTQNNLGTAYLSLGEPLNGPEGVESLDAAVIACQNALLVYTRSEERRV